MSSEVPYLLLKWNKMLLFLIVHLSMYDISYVHHCNDTNSHTVLPSCWRIQRALPYQNGSTNRGGCYLFMGWQRKKQTITIFHLHIPPSLKGLKGSSKQLSISVSMLKPEMPTLRGQLQHLFPSSEPTVPVTGLCCFLHWLDLSYLPPQRAAGVHRYASSHLSAPCAPPSQSDTPNWFSVWSSQNCLNPRKYLK